MQCMMGYALQQVIAVESIFFFFNFILNRGEDSKLPWMRECMCTWDGLGRKRRLLWKVKFYLKKVNLAFNASEWYILAYKNSTICFLHLWCFMIPLPLCASPISAVFTVHTPFRLKGIEKFVFLFLFSWYGKVSLRNFSLHMFIKIPVCVVSL